MGARSYDAVGWGTPIGEYYESHGARHMTNHAPPGAIPIPYDAVDEGWVDRTGLCQAISDRTQELCEGHAKKTGDFAGEFCAGHANRERARLAREGDAAS